MPCGGIYPIEGTWVEPYANNATVDDRTNACFHCEKPGCELWCEEWDAPIHKACVPEFLKTPEGQVILNHGHEVILE